jgi:hypothetical protein
MQMRYSKAPAGTSCIVKVRSRYVFMCFNVCRLLYCISGLCPVSSVRRIAKP